MYRHTIQTWAPAGRDKILSLEQDARDARAGMLYLQAVYTSVVDLLMASSDVNWKNAGEE